MAEEQQEQQQPTVLPFNMNNWKQIYSNEEVSVSIPYFFENFKKDEYSIYFAKYKYELNQPQSFMVCNLVGGMFQRLQLLEKTGFGSVLIFGKSKPFFIEGVWVFTGKGIPKEMTDCDDSELYEFKELDIEKDKELITKYLSWEGDFEGKELLEGKVFK